MGALIDVNTHGVHVRPGGDLHGIDINMNGFMDALPILAVAACYAKGVTRITGAGMARHKECDRIQAIAMELTKMGACIDETNDGLIVEGRALHGCVVETYHDHRMVMALSVAGLAAAGTTTVNGIDIVTKSYQRFFDDILPC